MWSENNCPAGLNQIYMDSGTQARAGWVKNEGETKKLVSILTHTDSLASESVTFASEGTGI